MIGSLLACLMAAYNVQIPQPIHIIENKSSIKYQAIGALAELAHQISDPAADKADDCLKRLDKTLNKLDTLTGTLEALDIIPQNNLSMHEEHLKNIIFDVLYHDVTSTWVHDHHQLYGLFFKTEYIRGCTPLFETYAAQAMENTMIQLIALRGRTDISALDTVVDLLLKRRRALFNQIIMLGFTAHGARTYLRRLIAAEIADPTTHLHRFLAEYHRASQTIISQKIDTIIATLGNSTRSAIFLEAALELINQMHIPMLMYAHELDFTPQDFNHGMRRIRLIWKISDIASPAGAHSVLHDLFSRLAQMHAWKVYENLGSCTPQRNLLDDIGTHFLAFHESCVNLEKIV